MVGDNFPHVVQGILVSLAGAGTCAGCPRQFWEALRDSAHRARLPLKGGSWGAPAGERGTAALGGGGRRQAPEPRVPGSLRAGLSRETRRLLLMQRNSPGSLPFSHNKHTAKSLASCFDEATCISPFSVYRKLLLKKVILVFTARVKGPGRLSSLPAGLRGAQEAPGRPGSCERQR